MVGSETILEDISNTLDDWWDDLSKTKTNKKEDQVDQDAKRLIVNCMTRYKSL